MRPFSKVWLDNALAGLNVPEPIRRAAATYCRAYELASPDTLVFVVNLIAVNFGCGDGASNFTDAMDASPQSVREAGEHLLEHARSGFERGREGARLDAISALLVSEVGAARITAAEVSLRPLSESDAPAFVDFARRNDKHLTQGGLCQTPRFEDDFRREILKPQESHWGAFFQGACVAYAGAQRVRVGGMTASAAGLWYGVDSAFGARGIGRATARATVAAFLKDAPEIGGAVIHCRPSNRRSISLATALGFIPDPAADYGRWVSSKTPQAMKGFSIAREAVLEAAAAAGPGCSEVQESLVTPELA